MSCILGLIETHLKYKIETMFFHNVINSTTYSYSLPPSPNHQQQKRPDKSDQLWSTHELREYSSRPQIAMRLAVEQSFAEV
jgi:hypothetical protein